jgi:hypothetical protein
MRVIRSLALALIALAAPFSRGVAQTCRGTAAFQDGRARAGVFVEDNSSVNDIGARLAYGIPRSFYGEISFDKIQAAHGGPSASGPGLAVGYQIHLSDTPFQFCPEATAHVSSGTGINTTEYSFGGNLGYRVDVSDWFTLVPAAGIRWVTVTGTSDALDVAASGGTSQVVIPGSSSEVNMEIGLVFNKSFTIVPGLLVPSQSGTKSIFTLGVSINWANAVSR